MIGAITWLSSVSAYSPCRYWRSFKAFPPSVPATRATICARSRYQASSGAVAARRSSAAAPAYRQQIEMFADLAAWQALAFDTYQIGGPQDCKRIVERLERSKQISDHRQPPQIRLAIVEDSLRDDEQGLVTGSLELGQELICQVVWTAHPEFERLQSGLRVKHTNDITVIVVASLHLASRINTGKQPDRRLSFGGNCQFRHYRPAP